MAQEVDQQQLQNFSEGDMELEQSITSLVKSLEKILRRQRMQNRNPPQSPFRKFVGFLPQRAPYFINGTMDTKYLRRALSCLSDNEFLSLDIFVPTRARSKLLKKPCVCISFPSRDMFDLVLLRCGLPIRRFPGRRNHGGWLASERRDKVYVTRIPHNILSFSSFQRRRHLQTFFQQVCRDPTLRIVFLDKFSEPRERKSKRGNKSYFSDTSVRIEINRDFTQGELNAISATPFMGKCLLTSGCKHTPLVRCFNCLGFGHQSTSCPVSFEFCAIGHLFDPVSPKDLESLIEVFSCDRIDLGVFGVSASTLEDKITLYYPSEEDFLAKASLVLSIFPQYFRYFYVASGIRRLFCRGCGFTNCSQDCSSKQNPFFPAIKEPEQVIPHSTSRSRSRAGNFGEEVKDENFVGPSDENMDVEENEEDVADRSAAENLDLEGKVGDGAGRNPV